MPRDRSPAPFDAARLLAEGRALRSLARSLVGAERADDLVQDSFVAALRQPAGVRLPGPWLTGVVQRLAARWRRGEARRSAREQRVAADAFDTVADPASIAAEAETLRAVAAAVHDLDEPFRTVVVLRFWHDEPTDSIASRLDVPAATVRTRLHRGLERLRERLDARRGGRAAWSGALGALLAHEPSAAGTAVPASAAVAGTVLLMNTKLLLLGAAALAVAVSAWSLWPSPSVDASAPTSDPELAKVARVDGGSHANAPGARELAASAPTPSEGIEPAPPKNAPAGPWQLQLRVESEDGAPVDGATVHLWKGGGDLNRLFADLGAPLATLRTDALGRAAATVESERVAVLAERDQTRSLGYDVGRTPADKLLRIPLSPPVSVRGRVLRHDGSGAASAVVTPTGALSIIELGSNVGFAPPAAPVRTNDDGTFAIALVRHGQYHLQAALDGAQSFEVAIVADRDRDDVLLTFPGALGVRGVVVDTGGAPIAGANVRVWRKEDASHPYSEETLYVRSSVEGRFACDVRDLAQYGVWGQADGRATSEILWVEPSSAQPHPEVRVVLPSFTTIEGEVHEENGVPLADARVHAEAGPMDAAATGEPSRRDRYTTGGETRTDANGAFALRVHPGTTWSVVVTPDEKVRSHTLRRAGIAPGTRGLQIVATAAERRGCTISGDVRRPDGKQPGVEMRADFLDEQVVARVSHPLTPTWNGTRFTLPRLEVGRLLAIDVIPDDRSGLAPQRLGPLLTTADGASFDVQLQPFAEVTVRVLAQPGAQPGGSTSGLRVWLRSVSEVPDRWPASVALEGGTATLNHRQPGANALSVLDRERRELLRQEVTLLPGANADIVVTLPAK